MRELCVISVFCSLTFLLSCSEEQNLNSNEVITESGNIVKLESPLGKKLSNDEETLKEDLLKHVNTKSKTSIKGKVIIENIRYSENENVSVSIIDYKINNIGYSILVPIYKSKDIMILHDLYTLRFVKRDIKDGLIKGDRLTFNSSNLNSNRVYGGVYDGADCIAKDCCKWTEVVSGTEYNCGCPSDLTSNGEIILTTSDGCKISM